jgi:hypothetical protein
MFPLIVDPLLRTTRLTNALMDRGSGLNFMYLDSFEGLGLTRDQLQTSPHPFYTVVSSKQLVPLVQVSLLVTFRDVSSYRTVTLTFEVVDFSRPYHIILGQVCYVKLMAIPRYAYLNFKIPRPIEVIIVDAKMQRALDCEHDNIELAAAVVTTTKLRELSPRVPLAPLSPSMPLMLGAFIAADEAKVVQINAGDPAKTVLIGASLDPK